MKKVFYITNKYYNSYKYIFIIIFIALLFVTVISLSTPYISKYYFDSVLKSKSTYLLIVIPISIALLTIISSTIQYLVGYFMLKINETVDNKIYKDVLERIYNMKLDEYHKETPNYLYNKLTTDVLFLKQSSLPVMIHMIVNVIKFLLGVILIYKINAYLMFPFFIIVMINVCISINSGIKLSPLQREYLTEKANYNSVLFESISSSFLVKIFQCSSFFKMKFSKSFENYLIALLAQTKMSFQNEFSISSINVLTNSLIYIVGGLLISNEKMTVGGLIAFAALYGKVSNPLVSLVKFIMIFKKNILTYDRVYNLLKLESEVEDQDCNSIYSFNLIDSITLHNISFNYTNCKNNILEKINFVFLSNKIYVITGDSGTGKTTFLSLLLGLYKPTQGSIIYNECFKIKNVNIIRNFTAYVQQEALLINDSIMQNITLGAKYTFKEVRYACKKANILSFIESLPEKYETKLGKDGQNISTGQKQRIAIARVLLRKPKIILFDEPTSNVDEENENYIYNTIKDISKNKIIIIVSHKLSSLKIGDEVLTLKDGLLLTGKKS